MNGFFTTPGKRRQMAFVAFDAAAALLAIPFAYVARSVVSRASVLPHQIPLTAWLVLVAAQLVTLFVLNLYGQERTFRKGRDSVRIAVATATGVAFFTIYLFFVDARPTVGRGVLLLYVLLAAALISAGHLFLTKWLGRAGQPRRVLVLGQDPAVADLVGYTRSARIRDFDIVRVIEDAENLTRDDLLELIERVAPDLVIYSVVAAIPSAVLQNLIDLRLKGLEVTDLPAFAARLLGRVPVSSIDDGWILRTLEERRSLAVTRNLARFIEFATALGLLVAFAPLIMLIAVLVKLESPGPILYRQERIGRGFKPFVLWKFRTMRVDAESSSGPRWASADDPRITGFGRVLRRTGLDELPQLLNVLAGQMSLVGARPIRSHFAEILAREIPYYWVRFDQKPSVTGWAQIRHDYAGSVDGQRRKFEFELFYLRYGSPILDLYILLKTAQKLVLGKVGETSLAEEDRVRGDPKLPVTS